MSALCASPQKRDGEWCSSGLAHGPTPIIVVVVDGEGNIMENTVCRMIARQHVSIQYCGVSVLNIETDYLEGE